MGLPELSSVLFEYENGEFPWTIEFRVLPLTALCYEVEVTELQAVRWRGAYAGLIHEGDALHLLKYCYDGCKGILPPRFAVAAQDVDSEEMPAIGL